MTDYTQSTIFTDKDNLDSSDPEKIISGADVDGELSLIASAVNSKLNAYSAVTANNTLADADMLSVYDDDQSDYRRITVANARNALAAANASAFHATLDAAFSVSNDTDTKIQFDDDSTDGFDLGGDYDAVTNYYFTVPANGYYILAANIALQGIADQDYCELRIHSSAYSNNAIASQRNYIAAGSSIASYVSVATFQYFASGTTIWVEARHNYTAARDVLAANSVGQSSFSGFRVA